jgi:hypothetical protein
MEFIAYHSTTEKNIPDILKNGFKENFGKCFGSTFGNGVYTSPDLKYVCTYNIDCNKILVCKIKTDKIKTMTTREFLYFNRKHKKLLEDLDLLIISDANEYVCKNVSCISVIQLMTVERIFKKNENNQVYLDNVITLDIK